jgi:hypothetical protein
MQRHSSVVSLDGSPAESERATPLIGKGESSQGKGLGSSLATDEGLSKQPRVLEMSDEGTASGSGGPGPASGTGSLRNIKSNRAMKIQVPSTQQQQQASLDGSNKAPSNSLQITQSSSTALPQELLNLIQAFRVSVEQVAAIPSTPPETGRALHQTSNDLIRYVSGYLITKFAEHAAEEERKTAGWRAATLAGTTDAMKSSADVMGPLCLQALFAIMDAMLNICHCDRGTLFLYDERNMDLVSVVHIGAGTVLKPSRVRPTHGVVGSVFTTALAVNVLSTERVPTSVFDRTEDKSTGYYTRSIIALPLVRTVSVEHSIKPPKGGMIKHETPVKMVNRAFSLDAGRPATISPTSPLSPTQGGVAESGEGKSPDHHRAHSAGDALSAGQILREPHERGGVMGVIYFVNKAHHLNHGEFDEMDEVTLHHATKILSTILQWTSLADLTGSSALDLSGKLQAQYLMQRQRPSGERTQSKAGGRTVTITEASLGFAAQRRREEEVTKRMQSRDFFEGPSNKSLMEGLPQRAGIGDVSSIVSGLGRRIDAGTTLFYRLGARQTGAHQASAVEAQGTLPVPGSNGVLSTGSTPANPQRDVRDVALFLARMEESWKAARDRNHKQEAVIQSLKLLLYEERKRWRVLHNLCVRCGLVSATDGPSESQDALLISGENLDDAEFIHRLNVNEEKIRSQQSLTSAQEVAFHEQRMALATNPVEAEERQLLAQRVAESIAKNRSNQSAFSLQQEAKKLRSKLEHKLTSATVSLSVAERKALQKKKARVDYVQSRLTNLLQAQTAARDKLLEAQRQETETLYMQILAEDLELEEVLRNLVAPPSATNPTPMVTWEASADRLCGLQLPPVGNTPLIANSPRGSMPPDPFLRQSTDGIQRSSVAEFNPLGASAMPPSPVNKGAPVLNPTAPTAPPVTTPKPRPPSLDIAKLGTPRETRVPSMSSSAKR